ncbi:MAG TPA: glycosyltransferase [Solirubrobacteraceae bacterium]
MRVLIVDTVYPAFLAAHYAERPGLDRASYDEQLAALIARRFGTSDVYSYELRRLGHEAIEVIANAGALQRAWLSEHRRGLPLARLADLPTRAGAAAARVFLQRALRAQINAFEPQVIYFQDLWVAPRRELERLRGQGRLVVGQIASAPPGPEVLRGFDLIVTSFPHYVERFRALGVGSEYLPISFDTRLLEEVAVNGERPHPVVFVGGVDRTVHPAGVALLERLCDRVDLEVWGYGAAALPASSPIRDRHRGEAWGLDMYRVLARSRVVVNRHIEAAEGFANNMRLYEATGMGAALVTERAPNLDALFAAEREVATYDGEDELVARIEQLRADENHRRALAAAGHERTLSEHTYERRIAQLAAMLEARLSS